MTDDLATAVDELEARFEERVAGLEAKVDDLENELQEERERRRDAERALAEVERDAESWRDDHEMRHEASKSWMEAVEDRVVDVEERVEAVARGEVDASELAAQSAGPSVEDLVPLHQYYTAATNLEPHEHDLTENQEIAARLFPFIAQYATPSGEEMHIKSPKVRDVIEREVATPELAKRLDVKDPNPNTVRRVMEFVGKFGKDLFEFYAASGDERRNSTNLVVVDREAWVAYTERLSDATVGSRESTASTDAPRRGDALTDGGDITPS
jgi:polyhydroxyalkanoate synthesis regulator phasin